MTNKKNNFTQFITILILFLIIAIIPDVYAASANISATSTNVEVGEYVGLNVSIDAIGWEYNLKGEGVNVFVQDYNPDMTLQNYQFTNTYPVDTSTPGVYTFEFYGKLLDVSDIDINDPNSLYNYSSFSKPSITITVNPLDIIGQTASINSNFLCLKQRRRFF